MSASTVDRSAFGPPRLVLVGAAALVGFTIVAAGVGRVTDVGAVHAPAAAAVETLSLRFEDKADGGVSVRDAADGAVIYTVEPGTNGFIRATLRGLVQERKRSGVGDEPPFLLVRYGDGSASLEDRTTGRGVSLLAFGPTNAEAFMQLFAARRRAQ